MSVDPLVWGRTMMSSQWRWTLLRMVSSCLRLRDLASFVVWRTNHSSALSWSSGGVSSIQPSSISLTAENMCGCASRNATWTVSFYSAPCFYNVSDTDIWTVFLSVCVLHWLTANPKELEESMRQERLSVTELPVFLRGDSIAQPNPVKLPSSSSSVV